MRDRIDCPRCGKNISRRAREAVPVAHKCPHGAACVLARWGAKPRAVMPCAQCAAAQAGAHP